jgi:hypothetical protein
VGVGDVFRTEQVAGRRGVDHLNQYRGHGRALTDQPRLGLCLSAKGQ